MEYNKEGYNNIFESLCKKKEVHTNVLFIESGDGKISYENGYGGRDIDSLMITASITKLFTTTCILKLLESQSIALDDTIATYLDSTIIAGLHCYKGIDYSNTLTISHLLFQTSGLPDPFESNRMGMAELALREDAAYSFAQQLATTKASKPQFIPGTKAYYANINFDLLGLIIEKITGLSLHQAYKQFIFTPLGLKKIYLPESLEDGIPECYYKEKAMYRPKLIASCYASGGMYIYS